MTVVLSIMCADGVVIAADSQITDSDRGISFPGQKLHHLGKHAAWAGSGARGVLTDVEKALDAASEEVLASDEVSGFYPACTDTSKKPDNGQKECSCRSEENTARSSSARRFSWHASLT